MVRFHSAFRLFFCLLLLSVLSACSSSVVKELSQLSALRQQLQSEYHESNIRLTISNGDTLIVSFTNASFNQLDAKGKEQKAHDIAMFVAHNYAPISQFRQIWVSFVIYGKIFYIVDYTNSLATYMFDRRELLPDSYTDTGDGFKTIFIFKQNAASTLQGFDFMLSIGFMLLAAGVGWLVLTGLIIWKTKRRIFLILGFGSIIMFCMGAGFAGPARSLQQKDNEEYKRLTELYERHQYRVVEDVVHVVHEQPRSGHDEGDVIRIGNAEFTLSYFTISFGYNQTIAWGGALTEGTYARVFYDGNTILRVDVKSP